MKGRILIEAFEDDDELAVQVDVSAGLSTLEAIGLIETAKLQHLQSKHTRGPAASVLQQPA